MKYLWTGLLVAGLGIASCTEKSEYEINNNEKYEKGRLSIEEIEKNNPPHFLSVSYSNKRNLFGQTVVRGTIFNNAKLVHYKDVGIMLSFYSKTRTLLEEDQETVYENITPGESASFKTKYFAPKGTDSVGLKVMTAKF